MASVHHNPGSPNWTASVRVWVAMPDHPAGGFWRRSRRSTGVPLTQPMQAALAVANELERTSNAVAHAENPAKFYERAVARLMLAAGVEHRPRTLTWEDYAAQWLSERKVSDSTAEKYRSDIARFSRFLGARAKADLREITHTDCVEFQSAMIARGLAPATARLAIKLLRSVFERARLHGYCDGNPAKLVEVDTSAGHKRHPFTPAEIALIFQQLKKEDSEWRIACLFGLYYGLRLGDAIGRNYREIHAENKRRVLRFVPEKKRRKGQPVSLPLVGELAKLSGRGPITPKLAQLGNPSKVFSRILRDSGIAVTVTKGTREGRNQADKTFHSWRHTCNTLLANAGVDGRLRQLISDHDSSAMNDLYTHPSIEAMATALNKAIKLPK